MKFVLITGSTGLVGSEAVEFFAAKGFGVLGVDNDMRRYFFGEEGTTVWNKERLKAIVPAYHHHHLDIRNLDALEGLFSQYSADIKLIIHAASQPSHDWAAREPFTDFTVNANGTHNLLELARRHAPQAAFVYVSTNKVYGEHPNELPLLETARRWELPEGHAYYAGIDESMSVDVTRHSLFGASKLAADILVQEYGRYFGMNTVCFRAGCLTGPYHAGTSLHGFLAYLLKCGVTGRTYTINGYQGKQVRDNIHSVDLVNAFYHYFLNPRPGEVYNIGGERRNNCSLLEAVDLCRQACGVEIRTEYSDRARLGDHMWYVTNMAKFRRHYPQWEQSYTLEMILKDICRMNRERWESEKHAV